MSATIYKSIKSKNKLFEYFLRTKDVEKFKEFKKLRNKVNKDIKKAKDSYYRHKFENIDRHKLWKASNEFNNPQCNIIPAVMNIDGVTLCGGHLSDKFNEHFLSCGFAE